MKSSQDSPTRVLAIALLILVLTNLIALAWVNRPLLEKLGISLPGAQDGPVQPTEVAGQFSVTETPTPARPADTVVPISLQDNLSSEENLRRQGVMILAMRDGLYIHLFAYHPLYLPLTRLTDNAWDDMTPSLSPDGEQLAYSSRQSGYWDLYLLNLVTGEQTRLTDTPEYEASPTWSPDGQWLAYEHYNGENLDLYIQSLTDLDSPPIQLTDDPGMDRSPAWSPLGREIAFVSTRTGDEEIWIARLDHIDDRFINVSRNAESRDRNPTWSADGQRLAWAAEKGGERRLAVWDTNTPDARGRPIGEGDRAAWSPDGSILFSEVRDPAGSGISAYTVSTGRLALPLVPLPGAVYGMTWSPGPLVGWLAEQIESPDLEVFPTLWEPVLTRTVFPAGRMGLVTVEDVSAPQPMLHDAVDEAFIALRQQVAVETGWDTLSSLENAYVALTTPPMPSNQDDWLYTGRAFALNPLLLSAGWMSVAREDFGGQTYWRVYLKARYQDGSMGAPLTDMVWDMNARYNGDPWDYEQGGKLGQTPAGYWVDLTEIAGRYGWERLPSRVNWRSFYPSIRYNQFVITGGLEWMQAMAELYPPEALQTPTSIPTFTPTPTITPRPTATPRTPSPTVTPTQAPTLRPTRTPQGPP